jgi:predicted phosphodiesterase
MHTGKRLNAVLTSSAEQVFDDRSKFILFSDCHRGDNSWADDFAHNEHIYYHALTRYYRAGYTYIEIGDGDELWENNRFEDIRRAHSAVFKLLARFHDEGRLALLYGNHDKERRSQARVAHTLHRYYDERRGIQMPLLEGISVREGLVLRYEDTGMRIFLVHGHQGDLLSDQLWWVGKLLSRILWRQLQLLGIHDPTRPAVNSMKRKRVERRLIRWVRSKKQMTITGHTHRPRFPKPGAPPYFNDGSCVHPRSVTGIEIVGGKIALISWRLSAREDGTLSIRRDVLAGPRRLGEYAGA